MRLEVFCTDRMGLTRELLDLLVLYHIDLRGIEISTAGRIYLHFPAIDFELFRQLMADIRRIDGVTDVKSVPFMPSERSGNAMRAILESLTEPVLSFDLKGRIDLVNYAATQLFELSEQTLCQQPVGNVIDEFNAPQWFEGNEIAEFSKRVVIQHQDYLITVTPVYLVEDESTLLTGGVIVLKSMAKMGQQLHNFAQQSDNAFDMLVAESTKMYQIIEQAKQYAKLDIPLLITGETGTGKDVLARACHQYSHRRDKPFLALNCAALPEDVAESELYGYAAGAYPNAVEGKKGFFEQANGGTVLLDEIGEMSSGMQVRLLRFLNDGTFRRVGEDQEVHVDVRVICATQKNLYQLVQQGSFREDLYYRLSVLTLPIPPLRERAQDILPLAELFVADISDKQGRRKPQISSEAQMLLRQYQWPGNTRQLKNTLYRAVIQSKGEMLTPEYIDLPEMAPSVGLDESNMEGTLDEIIKRFECSVLHYLYHDYPSTRKLAKRLGVSHTAIANKLREFNIGGKSTVPDE